MERRARLYVTNVILSMNGKHSDLSIVKVLTFLCKSAALRVMFFARVISCRTKRRLYPRLSRYVMSSFGRRRWHEECNRY